MVKLITEATTILVALLKPFPGSTQADSKLKQPIWVCYLLGNALPKACLLVKYLAVSFPDLFTSSYS